jgi:hypothetical protein
VYSLGVLKAWTILPVEGLIAIRFFFAVPPDV